jgi:membrane protease YdiL (CAAX protease family)
MINNEPVTPLTPATLPPVPEKRVWGFWATIGFGAVILFAFIVVQTLVVAIGGAIVAIPRLESIDPSQFDAMLQTIMDALNDRLGLLQSLATIISGIVGVGLIILIIRARKRAGVIEYLGLYEISGNQVLLSLGVVLGFIGVMTLLENSLGLEAGDTINDTLFDTSLWPPLFGIAVVIFAPLFEELFFRGFLFEGILQSRLGAAGAIIITSVVFAILHIQYNAFGMFYIFLLGIIMGLVRWKTRRLWSTLVMHAVVNLLAVIVIAAR